MSSRPRVMVWVQHLLGVGHLARAAALARAFAAAGWDSHLVSGGRDWAPLDIGGATLHRLAPLAAADADFSGLVTADGAAATDADLAARRDQLLAAFTDIGPDVLIVEHYPFGRRQMRFELTPLLDAAAARCLTVCSVRDILVGRTAERHAETRDVLRERFGLILVHGDRDFIDLGATFPEAAAVEDLIRYTGFLGGDPVVRSAPDGDLVVSAGGGAVGQQLEAAAAGAARETPDRTWRLLLGGNRPDTALAGLQAAAPGNLTVERARRDFRDLLARAAASVSQAGYNTVMDILAARPPAVLVPFATGRETEQTVRAARLAELGLAVHLPEAALTPARLIAAVDEAIALGPPDHGFTFDGAARSVTLVEAALAERRAS